MPRANGSLSRPGPDGQPAAEPPRQKRAAKARAPKTETQPSLSALDVATLRERLRKGIGTGNTARPGSLLPGGQPVVLPADAPPPIPASEILSWFTKGFESELKRQNKPPMPTKRQAEELSRMLRPYQALRPDPVHVAIRQAADVLRDAASPLTDAAERLDRAARIISTLPQSAAGALMPEVQAATVAIGALLKRYPVRKRGESAAQGNPVWLPVIFGWMQAVQLALEESPGHCKPGEAEQATQISAVAAFVVSQMCKRIFGVDVTPGTIKRRYWSILRDIKRRSPGTIEIALRARREGARHRRDAKK